MIKVHIDSVSIIRVYLIIMDLLKLEFLSKSIVKPRILGIRVWRYRDIISNINPTEY